MLSLANLKGFMGEAVAVAGDLGIMTVSLTDKELTRFGRSFERQFIRSLPTRQDVDIHMRHIREAVLGAMIAKEQMDAEVDGEVPASNKIGGPYPIRASWLGLGDDWEDLFGISGVAAQNAWATGAPQNWIHSGTNLMGPGTAGNPIRVLKNAVHVVYGLHSLHESPKIESIQFQIDGKTKPNNFTHWAQKVAVGHTQRIKELDSCYVFKEDTTVLARVFISSAFGAVVNWVTDYPALYGVSYIKEPAVRLQDPATLPGVAFDVVNVT